jgi:hypothetical protein
VTVLPMPRALASVAAALIGLTLTLIGLTVNIHDAEAATEQLPDLRMRRLTNFYIQQASNGDKRLRFTGSSDLSMGEGWTATGVLIKA